MRKIGRSTMCIEKQSIFQLLKDNEMNPPDLNGSLCLLHITGTIQIFQIKHSNKGELISLVFIALVLHTHMLMQRKLQPLQHPKQTCQ